MDWLTRMNAALGLMEQKMEERLDIEAIAQAAYVSPFHFQRMFNMLTGMTVAEYMRKRKLTLAAQELALASSKVIDVSLKYGYDSPESFAKAFRRIHGIAPSEARNPGVSLKAFPRISFHLSIRGDKDMEYRIADQEAFTVIGKSIQLSCQDGAHHRLIPQFWGECTQDGTVARLNAIGSGEQLFGIVLDMQADQETMTYMIATKGSPSTQTDGLERRTVPANTWAVFASVGPVASALPHVFQRIYQEWFPATGYEHANGPVLEVYPPGDVTAADYRCEAWVPVVKK